MLLVVDDKMVLDAAGLDNRGLVGCFLIGVERVHDDVLVRCDGGCVEHRRVGKWVRDSGGLLAAEGEVAEHAVNIIVCGVELLLEFDDDAATSPDGVEHAGVGLEDEGTHGVQAELWVGATERLLDATDAEDAVHVEEAVLLVGEEVAHRRAVFLFTMLTHPTPGSTG